jgi:hypothetical protein
MPDKAYTDNHPAYTCEQAIADLEANVPGREITARMGETDGWALSCLQAYHGIPPQHSRGWKGESELEVRARLAARHAQVPRRRCAPGSRVSRGAAPLPRGVLL